MNWKIVLMILIWVLGKIKDLDKDGKIDALEDHGELKDGEIQKKAESG